jgi:hypothetical protein
MRAAILVLFITSAFAETCSNCHEIAPTAAQWKASSHRNVACESCHGGTFQRDNVGRAVKHVRGQVPEHIRLKFPQVTDMVERCRSCHRGEHADWSTGPHGNGFAKVLTDEKHNGKRLLMDDCFRCHGMFYEGSIGQAVRPIATTGPWKLVKPELAKHPTIPCSTCHTMHTDGEPHARGVRREVHRPSLAFWDRRSGEHIRVDDLPIPTMLEGVRPVKMSPDKRQALCYQCHAPAAARQVWSGDDRTPVGVHEGLSCLACHAKHGQSASASCATCHPRLSNCGLDVEKMDTTFVNEKSRFNVHTVKCADCHQKGVPKRKAAL